MIMNRTDIEARIMQQIRQMPDREECTGDMDLMDEIGFSSIEVMELVSYVEEDFGVRITSRDLRKVATPEDLAELIAGKL